MIFDRKRLSRESEETVARLEELLAAAKAGELDHAAFALRVFKQDGTYEDVVIGGTPEQQAAALAKLRATDD